MKHKTDKKNHPRSLVILNFSEDHNRKTYQRFKRDHLLGDDVVVIENPKDEADFIQKLQNIKEPFDRVIVHSHGAKSDKTTLIKLTQAGNIAVSDVLRLINDNSHMIAQEIHLYACHVGSHSEQIKHHNSSSQYFQDLVQSTPAGQYVFLHGDDKTSSKALNMESIADLLQTLFELSTLRPQSNLQRSLVSKHDTFASKMFHQKYQKPPMGCQRHSIRNLQNLQQTSH